MEKIYLDFECSQQVMVRTDSTEVVADAVAKHVARFAFCSKWDGLTLYARFKEGYDPQGVGTCYDVEISDGQCEVPHEVIKCGNFNVCAFGEDSDGVKLTSNPIRIPVTQA